MQRILLIAVTLLGGAAPLPQLHYVGYAAGLRVLDLQIGYDLEPSGYSLISAVRVVGLLGALMSGETLSHVQGGWDAGAPAPRHYDSAGVWRGVARQTVIDYAGGRPTVRALLPDPDPEPREAVPPEQQAGTVDTLSALAATVREVAASNRCDGRVRLFDGRRLSEVSAYTAGFETLPASSRSAYRGPALRCEFEGRLLAGFRQDDDRDRAARPQHGVAWFAAVAGGPPVPVRIAFESRWFGQTTMYLSE